MSILNKINIKTISDAESARKYFEKKLVEYGYPLNTQQHVSRTHIDWNSLKGFSFFYDYVGNEDLISFFKKSRLCNPERKVLLELNPGTPIIEMSSVLFTENWEDIVNENSFGVSGISTDGELAFEFADDSNYMLYSNFQIK